MEEKQFTLFTVLGWEERFLLSLNHILDNYKIDKVYLICFIDYLFMEKMEESLETIKILLEKRNIQLCITELEYNDSISNWKKMDKFFNALEIHKALINITTFPRETIWTFLFFLKTKVSSVTFIYYKPESYDNNEGGLTKNHKTPRLLFKHSGVFDIGKKLAIFIITGFDYNRSESLIEHYEPTKVVFISQEGEQFENQKRNCGISPNIAYENIEVENVVINNYDIDDSCKILNNLVDKHSDYNVIITSQGPKTSAISTYLAYLKNPNIALAYVPAREFSGNYSFGFDENYIVGEVSY